MQGVGVKVMDAKITEFSNNLLLQQISKDERLPIKRIKVYVI